MAVPPSTPGPRERAVRDQPENNQKPPEDHQKTAGNGHPSPESALLSDRILSLLRRNPSASRREIAAALGTTRSTVRYRLDRLREAG